MKTYTFSWGCDETGGEFDLEITDEQVEIIKQAIRNAFTYMGEVSELEDLNEALIRGFDFYEEDLGQDIRIYFPEELVDEVYEEDEEE